MPRSTNAGIAILLYCLTWSAATPAQDVTLDEIKERLTQWEQKIPYFWIAWEQSVDFQNSGHVTRYEWARGPRGEEYRHSFGLNPNGQVGLRSLWTKDRDGRTYSARFFNQGSTKENPDFLTYGFTNVSTASSSQQVIELPFLGLWFNNHGRWLPTVLGRRPAQLEGTQTWEGRELPVLVVQDTEHWELRLTLDPEAGYLPRVAQMISVSEEGRKPGFANEVTEFREVQPEFFFPWSGRSTDPNYRGEWRMLELRADEPLDAAIFKIEPGPQTKIDPISAPAPTQAQVSPPEPMMQRVRLPLMLAFALAAIAICAWEVWKGRRPDDQEAVRRSNELNSG